MASLSVCLSLLSSFASRVDPRYLHSFPTRRSSDLLVLLAAGPAIDAARGPRPARDRGIGPLRRGRRAEGRGPAARLEQDRKSTRLNSSHLGISYAVFCLKKKNPIDGLPRHTPRSPW